VGTRSKKRGVPPTALEQSEVERLLRIEVAVEDGLGHSRSGGDLVEAGARVSALAEEPAGRLEDQLAALGGGKALLCGGHHLIFAKLPDGNLLTPERPLQPVQWAAILGSIAVLAWSVPGLIVNPDFHIGTDATSVRVLGVDMNGWHAVSGFLVAIRSSRRSGAPGPASSISPPRVRCSRRRSG
jgi:hypothetical protein